MLWYIVGKTSSEALNFVFRDVVLEGSDFVEAVQKACEYFKRTQKREFVPINGISLPIPAGEYVICYNFLTFNGSDEPLTTGQIATDFTIPEIATRVDVTRLTESLLASQLKGKKPGFNPGTIINITGLIRI